LFRFWKYPMVLGAVNELSARHLDLIDDKDKGFVPTMKRYVANSLGLGLPPLFGSLRSKEAFPQYLADWVGDQQVLLPFRDRGRLLNFDMTWTLPWGDLGEMGVGPIARNMGLPMYPRQLEPANPWFQTFGAFMGRDLFMGKDLVTREGAKPPEYWSAIAQFTLRTWLPPLTPGVGHSANKLWRAATNQVNERDTPSLLIAGLSELPGIKIRSHDPWLGADYQISHQRRVVNDLERLIKDAREFRKDESGLQKIKAEEEAKLDQMEKDKREIGPEPQELLELKRERKIRRDTAPPEFFKTKKRKKRKVTPQRKKQ